MNNALRIILIWGLMTPINSLHCWAYESHYQSQPQLARNPSMQPLIRPVGPMDLSYRDTSWFLNNTQDLAGFRLDLFSARNLQFQVPDLNNEMWIINKEDLQFDQKKVDSLTVTIQTPLNTRLDYDLSKINYPDALNAPASFVQTVKDPAGTSFNRHRVHQISIPNSSYQRHQQYIQKKYPEAAHNPMSPEYASLPQAPTQELIQSFEDSWAIKSTEFQTEKTQVSVHAMQYHNGRHLNHYEGTVKKGGDTLTFVVDMPRGNNGEIEGVHVEISAQNTPTVTVTWQPVEGINPDASFQTFRDALPVPLLAGPRITTRINGVDVYESPLWGFMFL